MGHGYVRANFGDNCFYKDTAYKRYNRAHGDTTIFNFNYGNSYGCCGGHNTGFWGGLGMSLGYGLGNWLMGGLNTLGGWLGMGNMGGFGNWFGGMNFGNINGLGGISSGNWFRKPETETKTKTETVEVEKTDSEYKAINNAREQLQKLQGKKDPVTAEEIKALEEQINKLTSKDKVNDKENKKQIEMLKTDFENFKAAHPDLVSSEVEEPENGDDGVKEPAAGDTTQKPEDKDTTAVVDNTGKKDAQTAPAETKVDETPAPVNTEVKPEATPVTDSHNTEIDKAKDAEELLKTLPDGGYDKLSKEDKDAFDKKLDELLPNMSDEDKQLLLSKALPSSTKAKIKATYYDGFSNYDGKTELKDGTVIDAQDTSRKTRPTENINKQVTKITKSSNGLHPQTIEINDRNKITYTYKGTVDGEYIYTSNQDKQDYVLQKQGGDYCLRQYPWHKGYGTADWR